MKILLCSVLFNLMFLGASADWTDGLLPESIEHHDGKPYGLRYKGQVFPRGTFIYVEDPESKHIEPRFISEVITPRDTDTVKRGEDYVGRPLDGIVYELNRYGHWVTIRAKKPLPSPKVKLELKRGDILIRDRVRFAIYENGFREYLPGDMEVDY